MWQWLFTKLKEPSNRVFFLSLRDQGGFNTVKSQPAPLVDCLYKTGATDVEYPIGELSANFTVLYLSVGWWEHRFARLVITSVATSPRLWARRHTKRSLPSLPRYCYASERARVGGQWRITERYPEGTCDGFARHDRFPPADIVDFWCVGGNKNIRTQEGYFSVLLTETCSIL